MATILDELKVVITAQTTQATREIGKVQTQINNLTSKKNVISLGADTTVLKGVSAAANDVFQSIKQGGTGLSASLTNLISSIASVGAATSSVTTTQLAAQAAQTAAIQTQIGKVDQLKRKYKELQEELKHSVVMEEYFWSGEATKDIGATKEEADYGIEYSAKQSRKLRQEVKASGQEFGKETTKLKEMQEALKNTGIESVSLKEALTSAFKNIPKMIESALASMGRLGLIIKGLAGAVAGLLIVLAPLLITLGALKIAESVGNALVSATEQAVQYDAAVRNLNFTLGEAAGTMQKWIDTNAGALGMSKLTAETYAAKFALMTKDFVNSAEDNAAAAANLLQVSAVVASRTGEGVEQTIGRIQSGLRGETESIEDIGIYVTESAMKQSDAYQQLGIDYANLTEQQKKYIRYSMIIQQANAAYGTSIEQGPASTVAQFQAALADLQLALSQAFLPIMVTILPSLTNFITFMGGAIKFTLYFLGSINAAIPGIGNFIAAIGALALVFGVLTGNIFAAVGGIAAFMAGIGMKFGLKAGDYIPEVETNKWSNSLGDADKSTENIAKNLKDTKKSIKEINKNLAGFDEINNLGPAFTNIAGGAEDVANAISSPAAGGIGNIPAIAFPEIETGDPAPTVDGWFERIKSRWDRGINNIKIWWSNLWSGEFWKQKWDGFVEWFNNLWIVKSIKRGWNSFKTDTSRGWKDFIAGLKFHFNGFVYRSRVGWGKMKTNANNTWNSIKNKWNDTKTTMQSKMDDFKQRWDTKWQEIKDGFNTKAGELQTTWDEFKADPKEFVLNYIQNGWEDASTKWEEFKDSEAVKTITAKVDDTWTTITEKWDELKNSEAVKTITAAADNAWTTITNKWDEIKNSDAVKTITGKVDNAWETIKSKWGDIIDGTAWKTIAARTGDGWQGVKDKWDAFTDGTIWKTITARTGNGWQGVKDKWDNFTDGTIWKTITARTADGWKPVKDKWDNFTDKTVELRATIVSGAIRIMNNFIKALNGIITGLRIVISAWNRMPGSKDIKLPGYISYIALAKGGVVDGPTRALIGEAGAEAVVPLERNTGWADAIANTLLNKLDGNISGGGNNNRPLNITLKVGNQEFGRIAVDSINDLIRREGTIPLTI